jgi:hypothetical protein
MLATPPVPQLNNAVLPDFAGSLATLPIQLEITPLALVVLTLLVGIFVAALSVVLVYHWRRFPFEHDTFRSAERLYLAGVVILLAVAVAGILIS